MIKDLRSILMECLQEISNHRILYRLALPRPYAFATMGYLQEQIQQNIQDGNKARLFVDLELDGSDYSIRISTKKIKGQIVAQHASLIEQPNGEIYLYHYLNQRDYGTLKNGNTIVKGIRPEEAFKKVFKRVYMLSQQPH